MKPFAWQSIAANSLLLVALAAAQPRPHYGGTLRITMHESPTAIDPAGCTPSGSIACGNLTSLVFETLVSSDEGARVQPILADSWQLQPDSRHWQFHIRRGVKLHDGTALSAEFIANALHGINPLWKVLVSGETVVIELPQPDPDLLSELALPRNAITNKNSDGTLAGTGPFRITVWDPGNKLSLAANEDYWRGRPFLDAIEIELGRNFRDQLSDIALGRSDLIEVSPEQAHRAASDGLRVIASSPMELGALLFTHRASSEDDKRLRSALALSLDRTSIRNVILQGAGQPAGGLLPNWMSGYEFVFPIDADLAAARHAATQVPVVPEWTVGYDALDPLSEVIAERIILNGRDAGLKLRASANAPGDVRLLRLPLVSADPWMALAALVARADMSLPRSSGSIEELMVAEKALLDTQQLLPLFHVPVNYAVAPQVKNWSVREDGNWNLADTWLERKKP
jgi:peptide/nickel transport system substrate-binding protein